MLPREHPAAPTSCTPGRPRSHAARCKTGHIGTNIGLDWSRGLGYIGAVDWAILGRCGLALLERWIRLDWGSGLGIFTRLCLYN